MNKTSEKNIKIKYSAHTIDTLIDKQLNSAS